MSIENISKCDECSSFLTEGDECYCGKCVQELRDLLEERDKRIEELEEAVSDSI